MLEKTSRQVPNILHDGFFHANMGLKSLIRERNVFIANIKI